MKIYRNHLSDEELKNTYLVYKNGKVIIKNRLEE